MMKDLLLSTVSALTFSVIGAGMGMFIMTIAHAQEESCVCPDPTPCPPEGYTLVADQVKDTTMQEALEAIRAAREMTQEK